MFFLTSCALVIIHLHLSISLNSRLPVNAQQKIISSEGLPHISDGDSGSYLTDHEATDWINVMGFQHMPAIPLHHQPSSLAESSILSLKSGVKTASTEALLSSKRMRKSFLVWCRNSADPTNISSPVKLIKDRLLGSNLIRMGSSDVPYHQRILDSSQLDGESNLSSSRLGR